MLALLAGCGDSHPADLTERGLKELRSGQYDKAIATCTQAVQLDPRNDEALLYRGRAYHFRNAKGDPQHALEDFTDAIELAPKSSDAYYSRALVYRELGKTRLADADDESARALDGHLRALDRRLPEPLPALVENEPPAATNDAAASGLPASDDEQRALYDQLKERFEPGFGKLRTKPTKPDDSQNSKVSNESSIERYRRLLEAPVYVMPEHRESLPGETGGDFRPLSPLPAPGGSAASSAGRPFRPMPSSPFQARGPADAGVGFVPPVQSPFGQHAPAPTGRQSIGPFSPAPFGPLPQGSPNPNSLVRPPNPRDFVP
jgi:hypothetical protein